MPNDDSLLEGLRSAFARVSEVEAVIAAHPDDRHVMISLESVKRDAQQLEAEWIEQCRVRQIEVCRYKLLAPLNKAYSASAFAKSLLEFQELFSQIFDAKKNGLKRRARVSGETITETTFGFAYTFPGSLGVVLTMQDDIGLLGGKFEDAVKAFNDITSIDDESAVRDAATILGDAVIKKIYDWSSANYHAGFSVDITWVGAGGERSGKLIDRISLGRIVDLIDETKDTERRKFRTIGTLVMIDVIKKRFRFVVPDGDDYAGTVSDKFDLSRQWAVNKTYVAEIGVEAITRYATLRTEQNYQLETLESENGALG